MFEPGQRSITRRQRICGNILDMAKTAKINFARFKKVLLARRRELVELEETAEALHTSVELDQTKIGRVSRMDAIQLHAMEEETERRRDVEIQRIDAALKRIDDGEYGYCTACGDPITLKRLEFDPSTPLCIDCART